MEECKTVLRAIINKNEIALCKSKSQYIFMWGPEGDKYLAKIPLTGYNTSRAMNLFSRAVDSAKHMTFSKMTLEELLERKTEENA